MQQLDAQSIEAKDARIAALEAELKEARSHCSAIADVMAIIGRSPGNVSPVLQKIADAAVPLCDADYAIASVMEEGVSVLHSHCNAPQPLIDFLRAHRLQPSRGSIAGRAILEKRTVYLPDVLADPEFTAHDRLEHSKARTAMAIPFLRGGEVRGHMFLGRFGVRPFSEVQVALATTFADQAVIAIENARLFEAEQARTRELLESLAHQTATSEILTVISRSPAELQSVLDQISETVAQLCDADYTAFFRLRDGRYHVGASNRMGSDLIKILVANPISPGRNTCVGRTALERRVVHVIDSLQDAELTIPANFERQRVSGIRTVLGVPIMAGDEAVAVVFLARTSVRAFSKQQIALVQTLGEQGLIAIENARLFEAEQARTRELKESLEYQTATAKVLGVISRSPNDLAPVLHEIARTGTQLCGADFAGILMREGGHLHLAAGADVDPNFVQHCRDNPFPLDRRSVVGRSALYGQTVHMPDVLADPELEIDERVRVGRFRTVLAVPLLRDGKAIGAISLVNREVRPYTPRQIALVETFADQAVIAIENARLLHELQARTREVEAKSAQLSESLDHQTAIAEVLAVIARSPGELQPALDAIVAAGARLCEADLATLFRVEGNACHLIATSNVDSDFARYLSDHPPPLGPGSPSGRAALEARTLHVPDLLEWPDYTRRDAQTIGQQRTILSVPLLHHDIAVGVMSLMRTNVRPFTARQIALVETFARQAVIAIENARLFEAEQTRTREVEARSAELAQSLEYQVATSEVLGVISRSPSELQPVLDAIVETAVRLCGAEKAYIRRRNGDVLNVVAAYGFSPDERSYILANSVRVEESTVVWKAARLRHTVHVPNVTLDPEFIQSDLAKAAGFRALLAVPLLREDEAIGVLVLTNTQPGPFGQRQTALVETFASQAIIAINNVGLFEEVQARTKELTESLEYQTAISNVLGVISRSKFDLQPVLDTIVSSAAQLGEADKVGLRQKTGDVYPIVASHGFSDAEKRYLVENTSRIIPGEGFLGQIISTQRTLHWSEQEMEEGHAWPRALEVMQVRASLGLPLMRGSELLGTLALWRLESRPFTPRQIALVETFADQAVIAIENARLLDELQTRQRELEEALENQTAMAEVLEVISHSPTDSRPVFEAIARSIRRLTGANHGSVYIYDGELIHLEAFDGVFDEAGAQLLRQSFPQKPGRTGATSRAIETGEIQYIADVLADAEYAVASVARIANYRSIVSVPMLREARAVGAITASTTDVNAFDAKQIALLKTFADQAVIAMNNARLFEAEQARSRELIESLEYQTAVTDVLGAISRSPENVQPVLDSINEIAARLCAADRAIIHLRKNDLFELVASRGTPSERVAALSNLSSEASRQSIIGRAILDRRTVHVDGADTGQSGVPATMLSVPLLRDQQAIGAITLARNAARAFETRQIALVETFADQAVIAIENARLLDELQTRQRELEARSTELTESLNYQTATSEVLAAISRSPAEVQPVFDIIVATAHRLCGADWALILQLGSDQCYHLSAISDAPEGFVDWLRTNPCKPGDGSAVGACLVEKATVHIHDSLNDARFSDYQRQRQSRARTMLAVPLKQRDETLGVIFLARNEVAPFDERQVGLVTTFANQAVVAIENARLFEEVQARTRELSESLEYQTATSEVLSVISRSPDQLQPVLDAIATTARDLCDAENSFILRLNPGDGQFHVVTAQSRSPEFIAYVKANPAPADQGSVTGRTALAKRPVHIIDTQADPEFTYVDAATIHDSTRTRLGVPLLRGGEVIGVIVVNRREVRPFTQRQIDLVTTFADQAVIAINNVGLFDEVQARSRDLARSVEEMRALADVGRAVSSTLDMPQVLSTVLEHACRITDTSGGTIYVYDKMSGTFRVEAAYNMLEEHLARVRAHPMRIGDAVVGECAERREAVQVADLAKEDATRSPLIGILLRGGTRSLLAVPLLQQDEVLGALVVRRGRPGEFAPETVRLLETFAAQSAIAVNNARLFTEIEHRTKELTAALSHQAASAEVLEAISRSPDRLMPVLQAIADTAARMCETPLVSIFLKQRDTFRLHITHGLEPAYEEIEKAIEIRPGRESLVGRVALSGRAELVADLLQDGEYAHKSDARIGGIRTALGVPLSRSGEVIGVICLARTEVSPFTERQLQIVTTFASQAIIAINNTRLFEELQDRTREVEENLEFQTAANEVLQLIARSAFDLEPVLQEALDTAVRLCSADMGSIFQLEDDHYRWRVGNGLPPEYEAFERENRIRIDGSTLVGRAALARATVHIEDAWNDDEYGEKTEARMGRIRSMLGVPLLRNGQPIGVFALARGRLEPFSKRHIDLVTTFADQSVIAIENIRLFNEISEKSRQLELASQHKSQFLANMSHELRTPLNAILGYTELMQDGIYGELPEKAAGVLGRVQTNGKHLLALINSVLDLSKIEAGQLDLDIVEYGLPGLVEAVIVATESLASEKKLALRSEVLNDLPRGRGDERRLTQVLLNLVGNAIKFTDRGGITIGARQVGDRFHVLVRDTGPGIPPDEQERIFEEFHQMDSSNTKAKGGTGLGLAIAKRIIEMHGGRIWVESVVGKGATFRFEIPVSAKSVEVIDG